MRNIKFHTDLHSPECVQKVQDHFKKSGFMTKLNVDLQHPKKLATFEVDDHVTNTQVQDLIKESGYKSEVVDHENDMKGIEGKPTYPTSNAGKP